MLLNSLSSIRLLAAIVLTVAITAPAAMANDWQKSKFPWLNTTTGQAVPRAESADAQPAAGSIEAWQRAKHPALFATDGKVVATADGRAVPKLDAIEAWKRAKFSHLRATTKR